MSSYHTTVRDKETGEIKEVACIDDYFGNHKYGFFVLTDGKPDNPITLEQLEKLYDFA